MGQEAVVPEKPVKEQIRDQKRAVDRSKRAIERQQRKLESEKKKMMQELKKMAQKGQHAGAKMVAKQIVQATGQINKMSEFAGQLTAVSLRISACASLNELSEAMDQAGKAMSLVSNKLDNGKLAGMLKNFEKADAKMELSSEMMSDILEDVGGEMDDPEQTDALYKQVLQEVGLNADEILPDAKKENVKVENKKVAIGEGAGSSSFPSVGGAGAGAGAEEDSLDAMLKSLQDGKK